MLYEEVMGERVLIPIVNLPSSFTKEIHSYQRNYSVTMLMNDDENPKVISCSGTLARIGDHKGIITARHVWDEAKDHQFLLTLVGKGNYAFEIKYLTPAIPTREAVLKEYDNVRVPDICFLKIPNKYASDLEAKGKVFLNIDKRINDRSYLPNMEHGYWTVFGNPNEWLNPDEKYVSSFVYGTEVARSFEFCEWDYFVMSINTPENPDIPKDFSGMSGGGIWWTPWGCDENQEVFNFEAPSLAGVSFYQTGKKNRTILGHGPKSIYKYLYENVLGTI
jgi:hypothetical protein